MEEKLIETVYHTVAGYVIGPEALPGVENAFAPGARCERLYDELYDLLATRFDPDDDDDAPVLEQILSNMDGIQKELSFRMFRLRMRFALDSRNA